MRGWYEDKFFNLDTLVQYNVSEKRLAASQNGNSGGTLEVFKSLKNWFKEGNKAFLKSLPNIQFDSDTADSKQQSSQVTNNNATQPFNQYPYQRDQFPRDQYQLSQHPQYPGRERQYPQYQLSQHPQYHPYPHYSQYEIPKSGKIEKQTQEVNKSAQQFPSAIAQPYDNHNMYRPVSQSPNDPRWLEPVAGHTALTYATPSMAGPPHQQVHPGPHHSGVSPFIRTGHYTSVQSHMSSFVHPRHPQQQHPDSPYSTSNVSS